jgi:hypothetical protein
MTYPFWDVPIGYGILMGVIAVLHVFVSHFAIGGGLYLVVTEHRARRAEDAATLAFLRRLSRSSCLTLVRRPSGVGIWFIIGLLNPTATVLIHQFVWAWATMDLLRRRDRRGHRLYPGKNGGPGAPDRGLIYLLRLGCRWRSSMAS